MRYVNPHHPAGDLYPQEIGALRGVHSRNDKIRDKAATMSPEETDPVYAAVRRDEISQFTEVLLSLDTKRRVAAAPTAERGSYRRRLIDGARV